MTRAVVIGAGVGGLLAAGVLARHFDEVAILEPDHLPAAPEPRRGVPQSRHLHMLMARGVAAFEELVPGFCGELVRHGAPAIDVGADAAVRLSSGWLPRVRCGIEIHACTRGLLEWLLRRRLSELPNVRTRPARVLGLVSDAGGSGVRGVVAAQGRAAPTVATVDADLVVDSSGRGSTAPGWLRALGYEIPDDVVVEAPLSYVSRWYRPSPAAPRDWRMLTIAPRPDDPRAVTLFSVEGDRWVGLFVDVAGGEVPRDHAGLRELARGLGSAQLDRALAEAVPISPAHVYRNNGNRVRPYELAPRWPRGFVSLGDAVCALDPYYGLGMTATALGVIALRDELEAAGAAGGELAARFQRSLARVNQPAWNLTTQARALPPTRGAAAVAAARRRRLLERAPHSPAVARALYRVMHLLAPPSTLDELAAELTGDDDPPTTSAHGVRT